MEGVLGRPTLVLNRHWQPIQLTTVYRAVAMLWSEVAEAVDPEDYQLYSWEEWVTRPVTDQPHIRTGRLRVPVPEVVRLPGCDRPARESVPFSRRNVAKRDHYTCQYCGQQPGYDDITIDHVIPRSRGGTSAWDNCVAACARCNSRKADLTLEQAGMRLKRRPERPRWRPFWAAQGARISAWSRFMPQEEAPRLQVYA